MIRYNSQRLERFRPGRFDKRIHSDQNHIGKGPKGFQRSDERIREAVCDRLTFSDEIDASDFEVSVSEGLVTLDGLVNSKQEKRLAEDLIEELPGVKDVHNHLTVEKRVNGWLPRNATDTNDFGKGLY